MVTFGGFRGKGSKLKRGHCKGLNVRVCWDVGVAGSDLFTGRPSNSYLRFSPTSTSTHLMVSGKIIDLIGAKTRK